MTSIPSDLSSLSGDFKTLGLSGFGSTINSQSSLEGQANTPALNSERLRKIAQLTEEAIAHTKTFRNASLAHINRLPSETLGHIFSFLLPYIYARIPFPLPNDIFHWMGVLHVCRYWRCAALSTPFLWTQIFLCHDTPSLALDSLRQFRQLPFGVYFVGSFPSESPSNEEDSSPYKSLVEVLKEMHRLLSFHICSTWVENLRLWDLLDCQSAPVLESLTLDMDRAFDALHILPQLFQNDLPRLKNLYLSNVGAWPDNHFRNLARLHIYNQPPDSRPHLADFLRFLKDSSATLEELILVRAGPTHFELDSEFESSNMTFPFVPLPCLRYMEVGDTDYWWSNGNHLRLFFGNIAIPSTAKSCFFESYQMFSFWNWLPRRLDEDRAFPTIRKLVLTSFKLAHYFTIGHFESKLLINSRSIAPDLILDPDNVECLEGIEELVYMPGAEWSASFELKLLNALPSLRILKASETVPGRLDRLFGLLQQGHGNQKHDIKYARQLETLHISAIRRRMGDPSPKLYLPALFRTVKVRKRCGCSLKQVLVEGFPEEMVQRLCEKLDGEVELEYFCDDIGLGEAEREVLSEFWESYDLYTVDRY